MRKGKKRCGLLAAVVFAVLSGVAFAQNVPYSQSNEGVINANGEAVQISTIGLAGLGVDIRGTFTGTLAAQCTINGTNWIAVRMTPPNTTDAVTEATAPGAWTGALVGGCRYARVVATAWTSGDANVVVRAVQASPGGGGGAGGVFEGEVMVDAQPADDPHHVRCSDGVTTGPCTVTGTGSAGTAAAGVVTVQGIASMTPVLVSSTNLDVQIGGSDTVTVAATNLDVQIGGSDTLTVTATNLDVQSGGADLATQTTLALVALEATQLGVETNTAAAATSLATLAATVATEQVQVNVASIGGTAPTVDLTFDMDSGGGTQTRSAFGIAVPASGGAVQITGDETFGLDVDVRRVRPDGSNTMPSLDTAGRAGFVKVTDGTNTNFVDPCSAEAQSIYIVNLNTASSNNEIANAVASEFWYICSVNINSTAAQTVLIAHDDSDSCGSLTAGMNGGTTAATGWSFVAGGGIVLPNTGRHYMKSATANHYLCLAIGQSTQTSGTITYVSAP